MPRFSLKTRMPALCLLKRDRDEDTSEGKDPQSFRGRAAVAVAAKTNNGHNNVIVTMLPKAKPVCPHEQPFVLPVAPT